MPADGAFLLCVIFSYNNLMSISLFFYISFYISIYYRHSARTPTQSEDVYPPPRSFSRSISGRARIISCCGYLRACVRACGCLRACLRACALASSTSLSALLLSSTLVVPLTHHAPRTTHTWLRPQATSKAFCIVSVDRDDNECRIYSTAKAGDSVIASMVGGK